MKLSENFDSSEFACKCGCGEEIAMDGDLISKLQWIRTAFGKPIKINSGYRCPEHNAKIGGVPDSEHVLGEAVDISVTTGADRYRLIELAMNRFDRIGIAGTFIHLGVSSTKAQEVIWTYS